MHCFYFHNNVDIHKINKFTNILCRYKSGFSGGGGAKAGNNMRDIGGKLKKIIIIISTVLSKMIIWKNNHKITHKCD